jgi:4-amino-4-deoxy-L-arabinose transferase-like glycosyltransferase
MNGAATMSATENVRKSRPLLWMVMILLLGAGLRVYGVYNISPPGLEHDEVANWLIDRSILDDGRLAVYFSEAYGHEAGFHYLQAASVALVGDNALALRLPAILLGILVVAVQYALARRLFGVRTALLSAGLLAVLFWPVFYSRLGLRAISLPFISGLALVAWCRAWPLAARPVRRSDTAVWWFVPAGLLGGLSLYTYMAARAVPIFFGLFIVYLAVTQGKAFRRNWRGVVLFTAVFAASTLPLVLYLQGNPGAEFRIAEVDAPLRALAAGDVRPVLQNGLKIAGMFSFSGDPLWRQNVAGRPVFDPVTAVLFYVGLGMALWRWREPRMVLLLLWLATSAVPSVVTVDAPSSIRMINALLVVTIFPALVLNIFTGFSTEKRGLSTDLGYLLGILLIGYHIWWTASGVFHIWPQNEEVRFVWQEALTDTAVYLDQASENGPAAIGGWSPGTLDPATIALSMRRRDIPLRYFGSDAMNAPVTTLIFPAAQAGEVTRLTRPAIRALAPGLEAQLQTWAGGPQNQGSFLLYELVEEITLDAGYEAPALFDEELGLLGYGPARCSEDACEVLSYWRVLLEPEGERRFFLHVLDEEGELVAQHDGLDAPAQGWQVGDLLVQAHQLPVSALEDMQLRLGVYDPQDGRRLIAGDGRDFVELNLPSRPD